MIFMKHIRLLSTIIFCCLLASPLTPAIAYSFSTGVFDFQQKLAKKGNPVAQYKLAYMYENGQGTEKNLDKAIVWYKKAAAQRYPAAQMRLTYIETKKNGYNQEKYGVWLSKLELGAAENDGESLFLLGTMHRDGYIVKKDLNKAVDLFKRASKKGITGAETELESVQVILFTQQDKQQQIKSQKKAKKDAKKAQKDTQQQITNRKKTEKKRQDKLAAQKAKRDRNNAEKKRREKEIARQKKEKARKEEERRIAMEKQAKAEETRKAKETEEERKAKEAEEAEKPLVDKSMCKGKKARFLTTCR